MNYIERKIEVQLVKALERGEIVIVYGPRQTGKTMLLKHLEKSFDDKFLHLNGDLKLVQEVFSSQNLEKIRSFIGENKFLIIDEARWIPNIGVNLKIVYGNLPEVRVIGTGSSSFELANKVREPLTGRTKTFMLFPLSVQELSHFQSSVQLVESLENCRELHAIWSVS